MEEKNISVPEEEHIYEEEIRALILSGLSDEELSERLYDYHEKDIADAVEELDEDTRKHVFEVVGKERAAEIIAYLGDSHEMLAEMSAQEAAKLLENMDSDDAVDILENMDDETAESIVGMMDQESGEDIKLIRSYEDDEIGSRMTTNYIVIRNDLDIKSAMKELIRQAGDNPELWENEVVKEAIRETEGT